MADLVTLQEVQRQLRLPDSDLAQRGEELQALADQATAIVLALCNTTAHWRAITPTWTETTAPATVRIAILKQCAWLDQYRGDESPREAMPDDGVAPGVRGLVRFTSDGVVA